MFELHKKLILLTVSLCLSSCSLAPFGPTTTGRTYGAGNVAAAIGNANSTYHLKFGFGVSEDVDAGLVMEFGAISTTAIFFKYAFLNNQVGPSLAGEFGYGSTDTTKFYYIGGVASLAFTEEFELFLNPRINNVSTGPTDIDKDEFVGNIKLKSFDVTYLQFTFGFNVWFSENAGMSLYSTYYKGQEIETNQDSIFGATFLFKY